MAQKKVILKDGADELLPKTSASMVFTESGQTVENALKNAGSGGTGDSGIVDITSIYSKLNIQNGGIMGSEYLTALKGHIAAGKVLKVTMDGTTLTFSYNTSDTLITLSSSPMVTPAVYGAMMVVSLLVDSETGEYVGVTDESSGYLVQQMIPSNVNAAQLCTMNGYTKPSAYSAISPTDSINTAIGKLEAGIGSGGAGGGDNIYWLPSDILNLSSEATHEEILAALGGSLEPIFEATKAGKVFLIKYNIADLIVYDIPVNVYFIAGVKIVRLSFMFYGSNDNNTNALIIINANTADTSKSYVMKIRIEGYSLDINFYTLDSDSSSDTISTAVGGESGFKNIIKSVNSGSRLVVRESPYNIDLLTNIAQVSDNGDMLLSFTRIITSVEIVSISYTKSSNTFSCTVTPISMGS